MSPLLEARGLRRSFPVPGRAERNEVLRGVSLSLEAGASVGIVGESGSGKSTLGRLLLGLDRPDSGTVHYQGEPMPGPGTPAWRALRRRLQPIYQDPSAVLNPRWNIQEILEEPLRVQPPRRRARVLELLDQVGLPVAVAGRLPAQLSGGQKQRVVIARALSLEPDLLFADEPVSALDVSVQAQILNLLLELRTRRPMALLFVSHNIEVVRHMTGRTLVLQDGVIVEEGPSDELFRHPAHPFTAALVRAVPRLQR